MNYLRQAGLSPEEIHQRFIPRTAAEQKAYALDNKNSVENMKKDIAYLLNEVAELKMQQQQQNGKNGSGTAAIPFLTLNFSTALKSPGV